MRGHLEARGKGVWRAKLFVGRDETTGKPRYLTRTIRGTKREAESVVSQLLVEVSQGAHIATDAGTMGELWTRWIELNKDQLSPSTVRGYTAIMDRHVLPAFGTRKVRSIRPVELDAFYARLLRSGGAGGRTMSAQSVHHIHSVVRRLLNQAVKWGWCAINPATRATPPKVQRHEYALPSVDEVVALILAAEQRDPDFGLFLRLAAVTGARRGELCALRWRNIDLPSGAISISRSIFDGGSNDRLIEKGTKTHASRRLVIDDETAQHLARRWIAAEERAKAFSLSLLEDAFVFSDSPDGLLPWRPGRMTLAFIRLCEQQGLAGVRLHDLRHFAASMLLGAGVPVKTVSGRLGHANAATTLNVYAKARELQQVNEEALLA